MSNLPVEANADGAHAHAAHTGHRWLDILLAVTAIFISIVSLYVAIEHGRTERELVAANSWPFPQTLETDRYRGEPIAAIGIVNAGTGPAKVHSFELSYAGQPISSPIDLLERCCGLPKDEAGRHRMLPNGSVAFSSIDNTVLRPGQDNPVLSIHEVPANRTLIDRLSESFDRLSFRVCYCSALDECWTSTMRDLQADRVKTCSPPEHPYLFSDRKR